MKNILVFAIILGLFSCGEQTIELDLNQVEAQLIIEAQVTNTPHYQYVRLSKSVGFYDDVEAPAVANALVSITDDLGNTFTFIHNPNHHQDSAGYYIPTIPFVGVVGRSYHLTVQVDGKEYNATDQLLSLSGIDSLAYRISETEVSDPKEMDKFYEILLYASEPQDEHNYYLFKFYRNDSLIYYAPNDIYFSDDILLKEAIHGLGSPVYYGLNDVARMEMYSLSREAYVFYSDLQSLLTNDGGGLFAQPPSNPRTNLSGGAIGFFQACAVDAMEIVIEE